MRIREATKEDAVGIAKVHVESWKETYKGIISKDYLDSLKVEGRMNLWERTLSQTTNTDPVFVVVNSDKEIVGFASFGKERTGKFSADGELYAIYILKEFQKGKLGLKLLQAGINKLLKQRYHSMLVWVLEQNESRKFYESMKPLKAGEEIVKIAGSDYIEIAYEWNDLLSLQQTVSVKLNNGV